MFALLPPSVSSIFFNSARFVSDRITMIYFFLTHHNPSSRENLLLAISDLTCLEMGLSESSIDYMSRFRGIYQRMHGITTERIFPLFYIASIYCNRYPVVKSRYLAGDSALMKYDLLEISGILSSKETQQR